MAGTWAAADLSSSTSVGVDRLVAVALQVLRQIATPPVARADP